MWAHVLFLLGTYLRVELLSHMVIINIRLTFWGTVKLFYKVTAPFYISNSNVWELQFLYILVNTCCFLSVIILDILVIVKRYLIVALVCISYYLNMLNTFFHMFWSFAYFLWRNVYSNVLPILIGLFIFLLISCKRSLHILETSPLSDTWYANTLSHSRHWLFTLLMS